MKISKQKRELLDEFLTILIKRVKEWDSSIEVELKIVYKAGVIRLDDDLFNNFMPIMGDGFIEEKTASYFGLTEKGYEYAMEVSSTCH